MPVESQQNYEVSRFDGAEKDAVVISLGIGTPELYSAPCQFSDGSLGWSIPFSQKDVDSATVTTTITPLIAEIDLRVLEHEATTSLAQVTPSVRSVEAVWGYDDDVGGNFIQLTGHLALDRATYRSMADDLYSALTITISQYPSVVFATSLLRDG
jgi:hypothetical protein